MSEKETTHQVNESADKITVKTKMVRGEGTRDQDKIDIKIKGNDPESVVGKLNDTVKMLAETSQNLRQIQPESND